MNGKTGFRSAYRNPFIVGGPVDTPRFFGRDREIYQVLDPVSHPSRGSVSIVGERRIGKTSLLHYVSAPDVIRRWNLDQTPSVFLYLDFQKISPMSITRFWRSVLKDFSKALKDRRLDDALSCLVERLAQADPISFDDIGDLLKHLEHANLLLVLLLDEFEYLIPAETPEQETRTREFLSGLRALINQRERVMSLIVATREPLADLCRKVRFMGSPFYNNFATVILRPFSLREAEGFLDQMLVGTGVTFTPEEKTFIFELGGTHPLLLQAAASCLFYEKSIPGEVDSEAVQRCFIDQVQHHLEDLWKCSDSREKEILTLVAGDHALASGRLAQWRRERDLLDKRGLISRQSDRNYKIFTTTFKRWLLDHLYELDDGKWQTLLENPSATVDSPTAASPLKTRKPLVFISYSHNDEQEKEALLTQLRVLERGSGLVDVWSDDRIGGGEAWESAIEAAMASAKVAILLVSANFLTSEFINRKEVPELLRRRVREGLQVLPVIARDCAWQEIKWLAEMNVRPKNGDPIWKGQSYDEEKLARLAREVARLIQS